jgi:hypothetical protein
MCGLDVEQDGTDTQTALTPWSDGKVQVQHCSLLGNPTGSPEKDCDSTFRMA